MSKEFARWLIGGLIALGCGLIAVLDFILWSVSREHTISWIIRDWAFQAHPLIMFLLGAFAGGLVVHFLGWKP